jgi:hypothetical protein
MKPLLAVLIVLGVGFVGWRLFDYYGKVEAGKAAQNEAPKEIDPNRLPGLPYQLDQKLREAQTAGPATFKAFIESLRQYPDVKDPRLAWIELEYVLMISPTDPVEAKKRFAQIKTRTPPDSPIIPRIRALEKTYD